MSMDQWLNEEMLNMGIGYAMNALGALIILLVAWIAGGWVRGMVHRALERAHFDVTLTIFFSNLARYAVLILAVISCLELFGVAMTSFAAVIAAAGFAIGLAFQSSLSNFSSGVMLLVFRPFNVGDVVSAAGYVGIIKEVELFTTRMDTFDNRRIIIPNSQIFGSTIENISHHDTRRCDVNVGVEYPASIDRTREVLEGVANSVHGKMPEKDSQVMLMELGDSSVDWQVRVWTKASDLWPTRERLIRNIKVALDEAGIGIPFPQMDVHLDGKLSNE